MTNGKRKPWTHGDEIVERSAKKSKKTRQIVEEEGSEEEGIGNELDNDLTINDNFDEHSQIMY